MSIDRVHSLGHAILRGTLLCSLVVSLVALPCRAQEPGAVQEPPAPAASKEERLAEVRGILEQARKAAFTIPADKPVARAFLFQSLVMAQADAGSIDEALLTVQAMGDDPPQAKASALGLVAMAQARSGDVTGALDTINSLDREPWKSLALQAVVAGLAREGYLGAAEQFADQIQDQRIRESALMSMAVAQVSAGDLAGARQTGEAIEDERLKESLARLLAHAETESTGEKRTEIREVRGQVVFLGRPTRTPLEAPYKFQLPSTGMMVAASESEDPGIVEVRDRVREAVEEGLKDDPTAARESLRATAGLAAGLEDEGQRDDHLWLVAVAQAELKDFEGAFKTADRASEGMSFGPTGVVGKATILRSIAMTQAATGDLAGALRWAENEIDPVSRACALLGIAEGLLREMERESWPGGFPKFPKD
ncbi:MAG TPA: hypothetical protein VJ085_02505 [Candidatus Acidoferrales bacterium]|nr:hypothetical protein [Candidatus Acidoferrales bacterium]